MDIPGPILITNLLPELDRHLIELLTNLGPKEWGLPTIAPNWKVKDIAAHLLDGNLRALSMLRDNYFGESTENITDNSDLINFLNRLNADWVKAMQRISPNVLITLLQVSGETYCRFIQSLDPFAPATFSVAWAGEGKSLNWFHTAREYTEKWHHQQQIRLAVGAESPLMKPPLLKPYLETSMRALPHHYQSVAAPDQTVIRFIIEAAIPYTWYLYRAEGKWRLNDQMEVKPLTEVSIPASVAWKIFTKGIAQEEALKQSRIVGNQALGLPIFNMLAVMAAHSTT